MSRFARRAKIATFSKKLKNVKGEVRKTPTKNVIFVKPAKFAKNWKICKIRKFAEHCTAVKEEVERA